MATKTPKPGPGRPAYPDGDLIRAVITFTEKHRKKALALGEGNISKGVRMALDQANPPKPGKARPKE